MLRSEIAPGILQTSANTVDMKAKLIIGLGIICACYIQILESRETAS